MKLGTIDNGSRDGALVVVSRDLSRCLKVDNIAPNLQSALDNWDEVLSDLTQVYNDLNKNAADAIMTDKVQFLAPLPRAYEWIDGSAYINHVVLVRKARGAKPPETLETDPLVYQGGSGVLLGAKAPIKLKDEAWGCDFESEVVVITGDVPEGTKKGAASQYVRLVGIVNDVSLRNLIPAELAKGFGFFHSKPATAFAPVVVTPDELGGMWKEGRLHQPLNTWLNDDLFGQPNAGPEMHFSFYDLIEHAAKTRSLTAGTIIGSGTVSNHDRSVGSSCLAEKRMIEKIDTGEMVTPFLKHGDRVRIEMLDQEGKSIFGQIDQLVKPI